MDNNDPTKSTGAVYPNQDKEHGDNRPDYKGFIDVTGEQVKKIIEMNKKGLKPRLQIGAWHRKAKESGNPYIFIAAQAWVPEGDQQPSRPAPQPAPQPAHQQDDPFGDSDIPF